MGIQDMCRDHSHLTACQKQHRQNEPAGQVDTRVHVTGGSWTHVDTTDIPLPVNEPVRDVLLV